MNRYLTLLFLMSFVLSTPLLAQKSSKTSDLKKVRKINTHLGKSFKIEAVDPIICYGSDEYNPHYVPPRVKKDITKSKNALQFVATYVQTTPQAVKDIFEDFVFPTLSESFSSNVPIHVEINWVALDGSALASAGPTRRSSGLNLPFQETWYPIALAEKLLDRNLTGDLPDIAVNINSQIDWYFDFDNPAGIGNRHDLGSTLYHEVYHGLGFTGVAAVNENEQGFIEGPGGLPWVYQRSLQTDAGVPLLNFQDGSTELGSQLTGNRLFFSSENLQGENRAKIYAPTAFAPSSSIHHLDEFTYNNTESALMTPQSGRGEIEREAGIAKTMLEDMGWKTTSIIHTPPTPIENVDQSANIEAYVVSDTDADESSLTLIYFEEGSSNPNEITMAKGNDGISRGEIPATGNERFVLYYLRVSDASGKTFTNPGEAPNKLLYRYNFAFDTENPMITHDPVTRISTVDNSFSIVADVTDEFVGVESVIVETSINKGAIFRTETTFEPLNEFTDSLYLATIELPNGPLSATDILEYRIVAIDKAIAMNRGTNPASGFHRIEVSNVAESIQQYFTDFNEANDDFIADGFEVMTPAGFSDPAVHSLHPYVNAGENSTIDYTYQLKNPVIISDADPTIKFDEIVLVENGEPTAAFGTAEFWDFVIVEGQRPGSREWIPFLEGYDCRANALWRSVYLNGIPTDGQDSAGEGTSSLFRGRVIDMTENGEFSAGEEVLIRFRLFSDPFAVGWGWAIDNLRIQASTVAVEDYVDEENSFIVFPNPMQNEVNVAIELKQNAPNSQITVTDIFGKTIYSKTIDLYTKENVETINTEHLPHGMYLVSVRFNNEDVITKKIIK